MTPTTNAVLAERIENLETVIAGLRGAILAMTEKIGAMKEIEVNCQAVTGVSIKQHDNRLKQLEERMKKIEDSMIELVQTNKILRWLAGVFTAVVIFLIGALLTGKLTIAIK